VLENKVKCARCGFTWCVAQNKRKLTNLLCSSCRQRRANVITYGTERCIPWHGAFNELDEPMLENERFMPGERTCKHSDCVTPAHVVAKQ